MCIRDSSSSSSSSCSSSSSSSTLLKKSHVCVGFTAYLLSEECDIFDPVHLDVCQDMTHPLSHYFIAASHRTCVFDLLVKFLYIYQRLVIVLV